MWIGRSTFSGLFPYNASISYNAKLLGQWKEGVKVAALNKKTFQINRNEENSFVYVKGYL